MEERRGQGVRMRDIADAASLSRQAVYDYFGSRAKLLVATTHYVDERRGLRERRRRFQAATIGVERLESYVEFWGNYIPEVYEMAWSGTRRPYPASLSGERRKVQWTPAGGGVPSSAVDRAVLAIP